MESKEINILDLKFLESDLSREELVSVAFLLFAAERPKWILDKLKSEENHFNLLELYANYHDEWKSAIVEALGTIQAFECIENIGISLSEGREFVRNSSLIYQGVKLLYELCETLPKALSERFKSFIKENCDSFELNSEHPLELYLLNALAVQKIKVIANLNECDFSLVKRFENSIDIDDFVIRELFSKFTSKPNTLDTSVPNDFNESNEQSKSEQNDNFLNGNPVDNYEAKKMMVLIINQQRFRRSTNIALQELLPREILSERKGTTKDMEALKNLFEEFKYKVIVKNDLTHVEVLQEIDKVTKQSSKYDGLIICILSHGHEGLIYGSDSVPVFIKNVKETMSSKALLGKPKILLIQACQGDDLQPTVKKLIQTELDGPSQSSLISGSSRADFLTFWSTIEGFASVRHVENGSWFIQELVKKINELHKFQHLMDICTAVIKEVSSMRGYRDQCMLPKLESTFTKNFRF